MKRERFKRKEGILYLFTALLSGIEEKSKNLSLNFVSSVFE